ncbi:hypothetical protein AB6H17_02820 [Proteus vulgaris]|uniref:hypothetical protein n=1 Tax=Proteus vulgaris TaxID=585 RepID=UPI0034DCCBF9
MQTSEVEKLFPKTINNLSKDLTNNFFNSGFSTSLLSRNVLNETKVSFQSSIKLSSSVGSVSENFLNAFLPTSVSSIVVATVGKDYMTPLMNK